MPYKHHAYDRRRFAYECQVLKRRLGVGFRDRGWATGWRWSYVWKCLLKVVRPVKTGPTGWAERPSGSVGIPSRKAFF